MARKHHTLPLIPDYATEVELWVVEQELRARLTMIQTTLTPPEPVRAIQLSPISHLPNEILIHIFQHGLRVGSVPKSANSLPMPNALAGVCRSWRAVVIRTPELWTRVFVTSAMPSDHLVTYLERANNSKVDVEFCHWPVPKRASEVSSGEAFLESIVGTLRGHAHRLRKLALWDISDTAVCTVLSGLENVDAPWLTKVSIKANHTVLNQYYELRHFYLFPFLVGGAKSLTHLEIDHFPIETFRMRSDWRFNVGNLTYLILRTKESPILDFQTPPYLIEFPALCALLRTTPHLKTLALYGAVIEPDEDFPIRPPAAMLPHLETLIIHRRLPGVRYHCELLNVLMTPALQCLDIPWHDDLSVEIPDQDRTAEYLFDGRGEPRFASVKRLYVHDSAVRRRMPTRSLMRAFPNVEEVVLGGGDVAKFAATLRGFVVVPPQSPSGSGSNCDSSARSTAAEESEVVLAGGGGGGWKSLRRIVLKDPDMTCWKGWVKGFRKWLAARGDGGESAGVGTVCIEIRDLEFGQHWQGGGGNEERALRAFLRFGVGSLEKLALVKLEDSTTD